jgi:hypothetical protein
MLLNLKNNSMPVNNNPFGIFGVHETKMATTLELKYLQSYISKCIASIDIPMQSCKATLKV